MGIYAMDWRQHDGEGFRKANDNGTAVEEHVGTWLSM